MALYRKILLTTDFSDYSKVAIPHAVTIAKQFDSELLVLHVLEPLLTPVDFAWGPMALSEDWEEQRAEHSEKYLNDWIVSELPTDISVKPILAHGTPIREILQTINSHNIDLVIMATHGQTGIAHALFGSTSEKVVRRSPVPVLTVRKSKDHDAK
ncbi:MAG: universal stress protein [Fidelibacterota bacterium]|nr:MAG: universal stress protein [Candidatus Neomarinimicrobiota bacterium]